ncbi:MAG: tetratricopeptide repeat protein [Chloroflexi bacterium]|nr:tetratricopeptide repeat protein [Chloroflexota bacterium]
MTTVSFLDRLRALYFWWRGKVDRHYGLMTADPARFEAAINNYSKAIDLNPRFSPAYLERGVLYSREFDEAEQGLRDFNQVLVLRPGLPEALFCRALAYVDSGQYQAASDDLQAYLETGDRAWRNDASRQLGFINDLLDELEHSSLPQEG